MQVRFRGETTRIATVARCEQVADAGRMPDEAALHFRQAQPTARAYDDPLLNGGMGLGQFSTFFSEEIGAEVGGLTSTDPSGSFSHFHFTQ